GVRSLCSIQRESPERSDPSRGFDVLDPEVGTKGRPAITYSPTTVVAVPSAQGRLTSVFGMGTGGTTPLTSPAKVTPLPEGLRKRMRIGMQLTLCPVEGQSSVWRSSRS